MAHFKTYRLSSSSVKSYQLTPQLTDEDESRYVLKQIFRIQKFNAVRTGLNTTYSNEDKSYILNKINQKELPSNAIAAAYVNKILQHLEKNHLTSLEDLLNINGIGPKALRKICNNILEARDGKVVSVVKKKRNSHLIIPPIDPKNKAISNVVSLHIGSENISWALINTLQKNLLDWNYTGGSIDTGNTAYFLEMVLKVTPLIPSGDFYLIEDGGFGRQRQDLLKSQLTAMLLTSLQVLRGTNSELLVALAKPSLKNKTYNGCVGSERVSLQNHVVDMLEERSQTDCVLVPRELKERFFRAKPACKEDMAQALLLGTAFINVVLNKRTLTSHTSV